jgi:cytochrome c oxidase assembly factor CtaG
MQRRWGVRVSAAASVAGAVGGALAAGTRAAARTGALVAPVVVASPAALALALASAPTVTAHGAIGQPPPSDPLSILTAWVFDPLPILGFVVATALYLVAARRVDRAHPGNPWPRRRTAAFLVGAVSILLALVSPVDALADDLAWVHMVQHSILVFLGAPLVVSSGIGTLALRAASPATRDRWLLPLLHSRFTSALTFPLVGWLAMPVVMWGTHYSDLYNAALLDPTTHALEHLAYLAAALLFWTPIFSPDPLRWRMSPPVKIFYLLTQMPTMSWLAVSILNAGFVLWPAYLGRSVAFGMQPLADQQLSGAIMWGLGDGTFMIAMGLVIWEWMKAEEVESMRVDARLDRQKAARAAIEVRAAALAASKVRPAGRPGGGADPASAAAVVGGTGGAPAAAPPGRGADA